MFTKHQLNESKHMDKNDAKESNNQKQKEEKGRKNMEKVRHPKKELSGKCAKSLYDKIESIRSTISVANAERSEFWIQRQNLQDLYHQIILTDIDFVIDKKLEQELWNNAFKTQINFFQTKIRESGSSSSVSSLSHPNHSYHHHHHHHLYHHPSSHQQTLEQKKFELQAKLGMFLESARGFYTRLLEDILIKYNNESDEKDDQDYILPYGSVDENRIGDLARSLNLFVANSGVIRNRRGRLLLHGPPMPPENKSNKVQETKILDEPSQATTDQKHFKQINYICQHILTHLGDIARYQSVHDEAMQYYLHATRLVPYLGHPYNQLGILFESRATSSSGRATNQLAAVFYYMRSVLVRYAFPLASTNLDNLLGKLVDAPLTRFAPPSIVTTRMATTAVTSVSTSATSSQTTKSVPAEGSNSSAAVVKLPLVDLISLFLQINAMIYFSGKQRPNIDESKTSQLLELFKSSFSSFMDTPVHLKERLDALQLTQMVAIVLFHIGSNNTRQQPAADFGEKTAFHLLVFLVEHLVYLAAEPTAESLILAPLYIALSFLKQYKSGANLILDNGLFYNSLNVERYICALVKLLNKLSDGLEANEHLKLFESLPLQEDRMLESYLPMRDAHKGMNFKNLMINHTNPDETFIRKQRILAFFERALTSDEAISKKCHICLSIEDNKIKFFVSSTCPRNEEQNSKSDLIDQSKPLESKQSQTQQEFQKLQQQQQNQQSQTIRKRRQNVAIASIIGENNHQLGSKSTPSGSSESSSIKIAASEYVRVGQSENDKNLTIQPRSKETNEWSHNHTVAPCVQNRVEDVGVFTNLTPNNPTYNNGFPSFLPSTHLFQTDLANKMTFEHVSNPKTNKPTDPLNWLQQQQPKIQQDIPSSFKKYGHTLSNLSNNQNNHNQFDLIKSNPGTSNIWSPGTFPSANNINRISLSNMQAQLDVNPSMDSWQKVLFSTSGSQDAGNTKIGNNTVNSNNIFSAATSSSSLEQKDEQKSFEFNLNMMNMIHNTLTSPRTTSTATAQNSSTWSASHLNDQNSRYEKS